MKTVRNFFQKTGIALVISCTPSALLAAGISEELVDSGGLTITPTVSYDIAGLRVSSDSHDLTTEYTNSELILVDTTNLADGIYSYELSLATNPTKSSPNGTAVHQNGGFKVQDGIASSNSDEEQQAEAEAEAAIAEALAEANAPAVNGVED